MDRDVRYNNCGAVQCSAVQCSAVWINRKSERFVLKVASLERKDNGRTLHCIAGHCYTRGNARERDPGVTISLRPGTSDVGNNPQCFRLELETSDFLSTVTKCNQSPAPLECSAIASGHFKKRFFKNTRGREEANTERASRRVWCIQTALSEHLSVGEARSWGSSLEGAPGRSSNKALSDVIEKSASN
uniref:Uncharacterized protein n=1 Tax=Timema bartmani TaxID=61472 RepID=A0A7R9F457_9NEOP|nr:unnamed protein product [Timema bartmani]